MTKSLEELTKAVKDARFNLVEKREAKVKANNAENDARARLATAHDELNKFIELQINPTGSREFAYQH